MKIQVNPGMTLVEIVMVMVIIGLMSAIVMPKWANFSDSWTLDIEAKKMASQIKRMQQMAKTKQKYYGIQIHETSNCYDIGEYVTIPTPGFNIEDGFCLDNNVDLQSHTFTSPPDIVYFDIFGVPQIGGYIRLGYGGDTKDIVILAQGRIGIE